MNLDATNKYITVQLESSITTNQLDIIASYSDYGNAIVLTGINTNTNNTTPVVVVPSPGSGIVRAVHRLNVYNKDTVGAVILVSTVVGSTIFIHKRKLLQPGETLVYSGGTWYDPVVASSGGGMITHGNEYHTSVFTTLPIVKADADIASAISLKHDGGVQDTAIAGKANTVHSHSPSDVVGTAVITSDSRLSDSRPASDVSTWAKASVKPTYTTAEVSDSTDKRYCTDAQKTVIGNTSGNNSGDETASTIKTKLGITTLSGSNTGDQTVPVVATVTPVMDGVATIGASGKWADGAHIHPVDTSRAASSHTHAESDVTNLTTDLAAKAPLNSPSLVTPNIGAAIGTSLAATGAVTSSGAGIGYATGAGGTVTQGSSRTTGVTLSKLCGTITMFSAAVAAAASSTFTLTNTFIAANDILKVTHNSATNPCCWICEAICAAGSASIIVKNVSAASITEATPLKYVLIKGVSS